MQTFEIICLAKSIKLGGMCIAGLKTDGSGWLRPVSNKTDGALDPEHYTLEDSSEPHIFDIIKIPCVKPDPKCHQPENWIIDSTKSWERVGITTLQQAQNLLNPEIKKHYVSTELLAGSDKQVCYDDLKKLAAQSSLALIKPQKLQWEYSNYQNKKKFRAKFYLRGTFYDLPITDPIWQSKIERLQQKIYSCQEVIEELELENFDSEQFLLTISLGEPFIPSGKNQQFCYKLVAAVINVSDVKKRLGWI